MNDINFLNRNPELNFTLNKLFLEQSQANITPTGEKSLEDIEQDFKINFLSQQKYIRNTLQEAIRKNEPLQPIQENDRGWTSLFAVRNSTIKSQWDALQASISKKEQLTVVSVGQKNGCVDLICEQIGRNKKFTQTDEANALRESVDVILAPHTLYSEMETLFNASEALLDQKNPLPIEKHPFYRYFSLLNEDGVFVATLNSGPDVTSFTELLLKKSGLETVKANQIDHVNLKIFNNVESFFRSLDVFKTQFEKAAGKTVDIQLSHSLVSQELDLFCYEYIKRFPELTKLNSEELEKYVRLLSVFNVKDAIVDLNFTLTMSVKPKSSEEQSFWPRNQHHRNVQEGSNEISEGQLDTSRQIQNLNGSNESMKYIKNADGKAQFEACKSILGRNHLKIIDLGGGRGETNGFQEALLKAGSEIHLLNFDHDVNAEKEYIKNHQSVGISDVHVKLNKIQQISAQEILDHFKGEKLDLVYSSHCFYFILEDMFKASLDPLMPLRNHPLYKYFEVMRDDGVMVVTMQSGAGSRLMRNALLEEHGLTPPTSPVKDETIPLLKSFGNLATFLRHFEVFAKRFKEETGKTLEVKMHYAVANVPLGKFNLAQDRETGGYVISNPDGDEKDKKWLSKEMLTFYGNWEEQQMLATLTPEKYKQMTPGEIKNWKLENLDIETIPVRRATAKKTQETFLHILRAFAPAEVNMQHPNITLEIHFKN